MRKFAPLVPVAFFFCSTDGGCVCAESLFSLLSLVYCVLCCDIVVLVEGAAASGQTEKHAQKHRETVHILSLSTDFRLPFAI